MLRVNKRIAIPYQVTLAGQVTEIRETLPRCMAALIGADFCVAGNFDTDMELVGEISLELCNRHQHPINYIVGFTKEMPTVPVKYLELNEPISGSNIMTGYFRDMSTQADKREFRPYRLTVYLIFKRK